MAAVNNFQGDLLSLLNNNNGQQAAGGGSLNNHHQLLSRRGGGGGGGGGGSNANASAPPPPPLNRTKASKVKSGGRRRRCQDSSSHLVVGGAIIALVVCSIYKIRGYRIKFLIRLPSLPLKRRSSSAALKRASLSSSSAGFRATTTTTGSVLSTRTYPSFIDPSWVGNDDAQYQTLIPPSNIDFSIPRRSRWVHGKDRHCDDVLLLLSPSTEATTNLTHGSYELRGYFLAAMMATYSEKAMVVLDAPLDTNAEKRSWYDCEVTDDTVLKAAAAAPGEGTLLEGRGRRAKGRKVPQVDEQPPGGGLNRLIQHPQWLSHGCPVPCQSSYDYSKWNAVRKPTINGNYIRDPTNVEQVTCRNVNDRQATVLVIGLDDVQRHFERMWKEEMSVRPSYDMAHQWALRLGAKGHEAHQFAMLEMDGDVWDYASALMTRSGIIRFQPWIANEIKVKIKSTTLPLNWPYTAIWTYRDSGYVESRRPRELLTYFQRLESTGCKKDGRAQPVYVATDDPRWVQDEIDMFLKGSQCRNAKFILNPVSSINTHIANDCSRLHRDKIDTVANLMILAKSETYLGGRESSDVSWLVRTFRTSVDGSLDTMDASTCYGLK